MSLLFRIADERSRKRNGICRTDHEAQSEFMGITDNFKLLAALGAPQKNPRRSAPWATLPPLL
ncbi:MAG TPA: hypothetical protein VED85_03090 [Burkholderiaceae bacterium]|nr:hypothetical protein [Burkholderiaceae bacterium]